MNKITKATLGIATAGLLLAGAAGIATTSATAASTSIPGPVAAVPALKGGNTAVALDAGFLAALKSLKLTPGTVGTATLDGTDIHFPITGGDVVYWSPDGKYRPYVQGLIQHTGSGLSLTAGKTKVELTNFTVNPGNSRLYGDVSLNGKRVVAQAKLFYLHGGTLKPLQLDGNNAILTGTTVHMSADAAALLNKVFKTDAVKSELLIGVATITAQIK